MTSTTTQYMDCYHCKSFIWTKTDCSSGLCRSCSFDKQIVITKSKALRYYNLPKGSLDNTSLFHYVYSTSKYGCTVFLWNEVHEWVRQRVQNKDPRSKEAIRFARKDAQRQNQLREPLIPEDVVLIVEKHGYNLADPDIRKDIIMLSKWLPNPTPELIVKLMDKLAKWYVYVANLYPDPNHQQIGKALVKYNMYTLGSNPNVNMNLNLKLFPVFMPSLISLRNNQKDVTQHYPSLPRAWQYQSHVLQSAFERAKANWQWLQANVSIDIQWVAERTANECNMSNKDFQRYACVIIDRYPYVLALRNMARVLKVDPTWLEHTKLGRRHVDNRIESELQLDLRCKFPARFRDYELQRHVMQFFADDYEKIMKSPPVRKYKKDHSIDILVLHEMITEWLDQ